MNPDGVEYLDVDDLLVIAQGVLGVEQVPVRDNGLLGSAAARPRTTVFGEDAYVTIFDKAAALLHSLVKHRALVDGNNRLGWLATATFLELNGVGVTHITNDDVFDLVMSVTVGDEDVPTISTMLRRLVEQSD